MRVPRVHPAALAALAALALPGADARAQAITLPTVRAGGPPNEEIVFYRIAAVLRRELVPDDPATARAKARADRLRPKFDSLLLATLGVRQLNALGRLTDEEWRDSVARRRAIAADKYDLNDPHVLQLEAVLTARPDTSAAAVKKMRERVARNLLRSAGSDTALSQLQSAQADSLIQLAVALIALRKLDERHWWPVTSRPVAEMFWGQKGFAPLNVGAVGASSSGGLAYTELASPILHVARVSVSAVVTTGPDDVPPVDTVRNGLRGPAVANDAAVKRLVTGGGAVNLAFALPLAFYGAGDGREAAVTLLAVPRVGFTAPALGRQRDSTSLTLDSGLELHGRLLDLAGGVGLTGQLRWAYAVGSRQFGGTLGVPHDNVTYATAALGFVFARQYLLTASRVVGGPHEIRKPAWTVGLTAVRMPSL